MAPQRLRNLQEDSRSESSSTREKPTAAAQSGISKMRRYAAINGGTGSNLKDVATAPTSAVIPQGGQDGPVSMEKVRYSTPAAIQAPLADASP